MSASGDRSWIDVQRNTFKNWANEVLRCQNEHLNDLQVDFKDGYMLKCMYEVLTENDFGRFKKSKMRISNVENLSRVLKKFADDGLFMVNIGAEDICDGNLKIILGLIWSMIIKYQIMRQQNAGGGNVSPKKLLLNWLKDQLDEYPSDVKDFRNYWKDGHALCDLVDSVKPGTLPREIRPAEPLGRINTAMDKAETELGVPRVMEPGDMLEGADDLSTMTYISFFQEKADIVKEGPSPAKCVVSGPGIHNGEPTNNDNNESGGNSDGPSDKREFTVELRNAKGEALIEPLNDEEPLQKFDIRIKDANGEVHPADVTFDDGKYKVAYLANEPGEYEIDVSIGGRPISDSPFQVRIGDGLTQENEAEDVANDGADLPSTLGQSTVVPSKCYLAGAGIQSPQKCGSPTEFLIVSANAHGEHLPDAVAEPFMVEIHPDCSYKMKSNDDGTYSVEYTPEDAHTPIEIGVTLHDDHIEGSPLIIDVTPGADPLATKADGPGLTQARDGTKTHFNVFPADKNGNPISSKTKGKDKLDETSPENKDRRTSSDVVKPLKSIDKDKTSAKADDVCDAPFEVEITPEAYPKITPEDDGSYRVEYTPLSDAPTSISVTVDGQPINGSPFDVTILEGADAQNSYADGPGLKEARVGLPAAFTMYANTPYDAPVLVDEDEEAPFGVDMPCNYDVKNNGDGSYDVTYIPNRREPHAIEVFTGSEECKKPLAGSPFVVSVIGGSSPLNSYSEGPGLEQARIGEKAKFTIHAVDDEGNSVESGDEPFEVTTRPDYSPEITNNHDGTYTVIYYPSSAVTDEPRVSVVGVKQVEVVVGVYGVNQEPYHVPVGGGVSAPHCIAEGPGLYEVPVGLKGNFVVTTRDKKDEPIACAESPLTVLTIPQCDPEITDNGDGTFDVVYTAPYDPTMLPKVQRPKGGDQGDVDEVRSRRPSAESGNADEDGTPIEISVLVNGEPINESPYFACVVTAPDAVKISELKGDPIKTGKVSVNTPSTIKAKLVDSETDKPLDSMDFTAALKNEDGDVLKPLKVGPPKKGKYPIEVLCEQPGPHIVELCVNGQPIEELPIECIPETEPALVEGSFTFEVHARDKDGNLKTIGGEEWSVDVVGPNDSKIEVETTDHGDGRYSAKYHLAAIEGGSAEFKVSAKLNGRHVASSPFKHNLAPKPSLFKRFKKLF